MNQNKEDLILIKRFFDEALPRFNYGASFLDANAITLLNTAPAAIKRVLERIQANESNIQENQSCAR